MHTRILPLGGLGLAAALAATPVAAHHPGGASNTGTAGPIVTISATTLAKGMSAAAVMFEATNLDPFSDAALIDFAAAHEHVHSLDSILAPSLAYAYGITDDLMVSVRLPYVIRTNIREGEHSHSGGGVTNEVVNRGDSDGIGDVTLLGQYRFFNDRHSGTELAVLFGVKLPTGDTDVKDRHGERFETEFQPGSGSWDGIIGFAATKHIGAWSFDANVLYVLAGTGAQDTNLGDRFLYNAGVSYRLVGLNVGPQPMFHGGHDHGDEHAHRHVEPPGPALDLVLEINGEWHDKEETAGVSDPNSGGNTVFLAPGLRLSKDNWSAFGSIGIPIVNDTNGFQDDTDYRVLTGLSVAF